MKTMMQLVSLALGLAVATPAFAHDYDHREPSRVDETIARRTNASVSVFDIDHDGRVSPYEVKRVNEERRYVAMHRERAAARAAAYARYVARAHEEARGSRRYEAPAVYRW
jgi:hypothetical protein